MTDRAATASTIDRYLPITWDQLHRDCRLLAQHLIGSPPIQGIVAVSRGGLVPAAIVAREINCRMIETLSAASYDEAVENGAQKVTQVEITVLKPPAAAGDGSGFLVIDDMVDSGNTARLVRRMLPNARFVCVYVKPAAKALVDLWVIDVPQETWILFPWDSSPQFVAPLAHRG